MDTLTYPLQLSYRLRLIYVNQPVWPHGNRTGCNEWQLDNVPQSKE